MIGKIGLVCLSLLWLSACSTSPTVESGNEKLSTMTVQNLSELLHKDKTIQAEVKTLLGEPESVSSNSNTVSWTYRYRCSSQAPTAYLWIPIAGMFISQSVKKKGCDGLEKSIHLTIIFDNQLIIKDYNFSSY